MSDFGWLVPVALIMALAGLAAFMWSMRNGQYDDLDGAAERILLADAEAAPLPDADHSGAGHLPSEEKD